MTAQEIYNHIKNQYSSSETTICHLHQPRPHVACCLDEQFKCSNPSQIKVLNFDHITSEYCGNQGISVCSSTDAISYKNRYLIFVEIKGWRQFIKYSLSNAYNKDKIEDQESKYDLNKKIEESISTCEKIIAPDSMPVDDEIIYILVIDTSTKQHGAKWQLLQNLNLLAYDSSSIYRTIDDVTERDLQSSIKRPIRKMRVYCQNFDKTYAGI